MDAPIVIVLDTDLAHSQLDALIAKAREVERLVADLEMRLFAVAIRLEVIGHGRD